MSKKIFALISFLMLLLIPVFGLQPLSAAVSENYLIFNGGTVKSVIQNPPSPNSFALEVWIKPLSVSGIRQILTITNTNNEINYQIGINGSGLSLFYRFGGYSQRTIVTGHLEGDIWQKINIAIDSGSTKMFINDLQIANYSGATQLKPLGPNIILGTNFMGSMNDFRLFKDQTVYIDWKFDQARGETSVLDSSANSITGALIGGDLKIHFFGALPTPTKFILPTLPDIRRLPFPTRTPADFDYPQPTMGFDFGFDRYSRPQLPR